MYTYYFKKKYFIIMKIFSTGKVTEDFCVSLNFIIWIKKVLLGLGVLYRNLCARSVRGY